MAAVCLCTAVPQQRNKEFCQHFYLGENDPSSTHPEARQFDSSSSVPGNPQAAPPVLELGAIESVSG